jgi:hypothetical protein
MPKNVQDHSDEQGQQDDWMGIVEPEVKFGFYWDTSAPHHHQIENFRTGVHHFRRVFSLC